MEHAPRAPRDLLRVALARVPRYRNDERRPPEAKVRRRRNTVVTANNYANGLLGLQRFGEARALLRTTIPVALRVLGESDTLRLTMRKIFAMALYEDPAATRSDLREATTTLEEIERTARRMLGGAHPTTAAIERNLRASRDALYARGLP